MGARNRVGIGLSIVIPARQAIYAGGIDSLESTLGLIKSLKIRALCTRIRCVRGGGMGFWASDK
jgi:hypothetical protein